MGASRSRLLAVSGGSAAVFAALAVEATPDAAPTRAPSAAPAVASAATSGAFEATAAELAGRLRVGGVVGDLALRNATVTAVVRKRDGWLVDFWRNERVLPTVRSLKQLSDIDGLRYLHPLIRDGRGPFALNASRVELRGDAIETVAQLWMGAGTVETTTTYRLEGDAPALLIESRLRVVSGGEVSIAVGDEVHWGNVDYFVGGLGRSKQTYSGRTRWVGRKGACGDLVLEGAGGAAMDLHFKQTDLGIAPPLYTAYSSLNLKPGAVASVSRRLVYREIDDNPRIEPMARVDVKITDEHGAPLASKLTFRGVSATPDPNFGPDGDETGAGRFVWSGNGEFSRTLPDGTYKLMATAGIEREAVTWSITAKVGDPVTLSASLPRAYPTPGWISGDFHLHQAASIDADLACTTRVISIAAEGVELAVPSDHYTSESLQPAIDALLESGELASPLLTMMGSEVSPVGNLFGHFNVFPLTSPPEVEFTNTTPKAMFPQMRAASPRGIVQVNHPRWDQIGYFWRYQLDPKTGRLPAKFASEYVDDFDAIEVYNGSEAMSQPKIRLALFDWLHQLGRGHRYTGTGGSDSHRLYFIDPGVPRNFVHWGDAASDADDLNASTDSIVEAIKAGRVVVSSGPFLDVSAEGQGPGGTVRGKRKVELRIRILAASWIDVRDVEVLVGGEGRRVRFITIPESRSALRLDTTFTLDVREKTFVVVIARGRRELPNLYLPGVRPMAFSNPIWLEP